VDIDQFQNLFALARKDPLMLPMPDPSDVPPDLVPLPLGILAGNRSVSGLRELVDSAEESLWAVDSQGRIISFNRAFAQRILDSFGVVLHPGIEIGKMLPPEVAETWFGLYQKVQVEGALRMEYQAGSGGLHDLILSPIIREGRFAGISAFMRDITERKYIEQELKNSRDYIESLLESSADEVVSVDRDLRIVAFNSNFAKAMVESNGVMPRKGMLISEIVPPDRASRWPTMFQKTEEEGRCTLEYDIPGLRLLELNLNVIRQGDEVVGFSSFARDITERRRMERELERSRAALEALLESTPDEVWSIDADGRIATMNSQFRLVVKRLTGIEPMVGMPLHELFPGEFFRTLWEPLLERLRSEGRFTLEQEVPDARILELCLNPVDLGKEGQGVSVFSRDITERKRNEKELVQLRNHLERQVEERTRQLEQAQREAEVARDAAESANRAKSRFLANMSHELRTPLNAILGFAELLSTDEALPTEQQEMAGIISSSGEHLLAIINDILDLAKVESGKLELELCDFEPGALLEELLRLLRVQAMAKNLTLELDPASEFPHVVHADPVRLRQVIVNLVGNAIKFTQEGIVTLAVATRGHPDGTTRLAVEVRDTGCGIASDDRQRVFDPFVQLQVKPGTGLGLAITRRFVELMGGTLELESELGKGSIFRFAVPVGIPALPGAEGAQEGRILAVLGAGEKRILVIEDQSDSRRLMRIYLSSLGFQVREAGNATEGISHVFEWAPDLVLMDRRLPGMDGLDAVREIRRRGARMPIVAVTAQAFAEDREAMLAVGCQSFLAKPVSGESLAWAVAQALDLKVDRG